MNMPIRMKRDSLGSDRGSAMVVVLLVMVTLSGLGSIVFTTATSNLQNAGSDRRAGSAIGLAEAGIAEALAFMRANGTASLTCSGAPSYTNCTDDWGFHFPTPNGGGHTVNVAGNGKYSVWIQRVQAFRPSTNSEGIFHVFSTGTQNPGPGRRSVSTRVRVRPHKYPLAVFGHDYIRGAGQTAIASESLISKGCIGKRNNITFDTSTQDLAHPDLVPGAHSATWITTGNVLSASDCSKGDNQNIHRPAIGVCNTQLNPNLKFDRDSQGGSLSTASPCHKQNNAGRGLTDSSFNETILREWGYEDQRGLPAAEYAALRQRAQAQGNFYDCTVSPSVPVGACSAGNLPANNMKQFAHGNTVVYIKLDPTKSVIVDPGTFIGYDDYRCGSKSVFVVVEGGNLTVNQTANFVGAIFVPDGQAYFTGASSIVGTVFAKSLFLSGSGTHFRLEDCFFDNMPGPLMSVRPSDFKEIDRGQGG